MTETVSQQGTSSETLPESWEWTTLSEIGTVASGGTPKTKEPSNFDGDIPWITPADLSGYVDKTIARGKRNISQQGLNSSSAQLLPEGTVIFSSRAPVGYVVIATTPLSTNQGCKNLITSDGVFNEYVYYYLKGSRSLAESYASGTTFLELSAKAFGRLPIPLPPLNEQRRIVEKIEELFTKLDAGVQSLRQVQALLKSYRRSVLKAAVEGELSREWREAHRDELEPASELLELILQERREKFAGKKYKEPASPDTSKLPMLPDGWKWASTDQLTSVVTDGEHITPERSTSGVPLLSARNVQNGWLSFEKVDYVPESVYETLTRRLVVEPGDVLMSCSGTVGRSCVAPADSRFALVRSVAVLKPLAAMGRFLSYSLRSSLLQSQIHAKKTQTAQANIFQGKIRTLVFALPSLVEQQFIVEEVERRLSVVDKLEATVEANLKQANGLRQSILKQAFSGELVLQDPDDEPASALLERIREEHQAMKQKSKKRQRRKAGPAKASLAEQERLFESQ